MFEIVEIGNNRLDEAEQLVARVFPWRDFGERMTHWVYKRQHNRLVRFFMRRAGVSSFVNIWGCMNGDGEICGITGLYTCPQDENEADWLSWFCVDPAQRGQGIGGKLLAFSIEQARGRGKQFLRLYTSDDPNEAEAQGLYEKFGLAVTREEKLRTHTLIYRELRL